MANTDDDKKTSGATDSNKGSATTAKDEQTGDPGRTPGSAEGDEETVDESLAKHERDDS